MDPEIIEKREEFRERLTLGIVPALSRVPNIQDVVLAEHQPSDNIAITSWEQRYSTLLPHELKDFYLATDGFKLTWNYKLSNELISLGSMTINRIGDLKRVAGIRHRFDTEQPTITDLEIINSREKCATIRAPVGANPIGGATAASNTTPESANINNTNIVIKPQFNSRWKMFELDAMEGCGRVCLVFPPKPDPPPVNSSGSIQLDLTPSMPQVWLLDRAYDWHYLATNFTSYFRMMLYHLGLPQWQLLFTPMGPTPWARVSVLIVHPEKSKFPYIFQLSSKVFEILFSRIPEAFVGFTFTEVFLGFHRKFLTFLNKQSLPMHVMLHTFQTLFFFFARFSK